MRVSFFDVDSVDVGRDKPGPLVALVILRQEHRGNGAVGFRDDPELHGTVCTGVGRKKAVTLAKRKVVLLTVFLADFAPIAAGVPGQCRVAVREIERLGGVVSDDDPAQREFRLLRCSSAAGDSISTPSSMASATVYSIIAFISFLPIS